MVTLGRHRRKLLIAAILAGAVLVILALIAGNTFGRKFGYVTKDRTPAELEELLAPGFRFIAPQGDGPFPTAVLLSGCDGPHDNLMRWAAALQSAGWASMIVDSHTPRNLNDNEAWRLVCAGQALQGQERAGDIAVALAAIQDMPMVDRNELALTGASHGGWAILEYLRLGAREELPPGLSQWPVERPSPLAGITAAVVLYPYCGVISTVGSEGWGADIPVQMLLVAGDTIVNETECIALADHMRSQGFSVETQIFEGVTHGFDQQEKSLFSRLSFDAETTDRAITLMVEFLQGSQQSSLTAQ